MARLDALIIGRMRHDDGLAGLGVQGIKRQQAGAFGLGVFEMLKQLIGVGPVKVVARVFFLGLPKDVAVGQRDRTLWVVERHVHHMVDAKDIHRQPFQPIGQFATDRVAIVAADLLEIGELTDLHAVAPDLPAQTPGPQRRALPVIFDKADVMQAGVDADGGQ